MLRVGKASYKKVGVYSAFLLVIRRLKACNAAHQSLKQLNASTDDENEKEKKDYNPFTDKENIGCCLNAWPCIPFSS